jgi:hypothetical protein
MITIVHLITGLETGGAERVLSHLAASTDRTRFRSVVVSIRNPGNMASAIIRANVELRTLGIGRGVPDPRGVFRLDSILREVRPQILQTWLYHADFFGLLARQLGHVPHLVWNIRCSDASLSPADIGLRRLLAWCSRMPDAIVVNSRAGRHFHERSAIGRDVGSTSPTALTRRNSGPTPRRAHASGPRSASATKPS